MSWLLIKSKLNIQIFSTSMFSHRILMSLSLSGLLCSCKDPKTCNNSWTMVEKVYKKIPLRPAIFYSRHDKSYKAGSRSMDARSLKVQGVNPTLLNVSRWWHIASRFCCLNLDIIKVKVINLGPKPNARIGFNVGYGLCNQSSFRIHKVAGSVKDIWNLRELIVIMLKALHLAYWW